MLILASSNFSKFKLQETTEKLRKLDNRKIRL